MNKQEDYGLSAQTLSDMRRVFARFPLVEQAVIYGSRACGNYRESSDIDVALVGDALGHMDAVRVAGAIEGTDIPYKVDVLVLGELEHNELRKHIEQAGKVLYTATHV